MASWQEFLGVESGIANRTTRKVINALGDVGRGYGKELYETHQNYLSDLKNPIPEGQSNAFISAIQQPPGEGPLSGEMNKPEWEQILMQLMDVPMGVGTIAGRGAKTANQKAADLAEFMKKEGFSDDDIFKNTLKEHGQGWYAGHPDKKLRFEIDDSGMKYNPEKLPSSDYSKGTIGNSVRNTNVMEAYPNLNNIENVDYSFSSRGGQAGVYREKNSFSPENITIWDSPFSNKRSIMAHELQHAIQRREKFARGGNATSVPVNERPVSNKWTKWNENQDAASRLRNLHDSPAYKTELDKSNELWNADFDHRLQELWDQTPNPQTDEWKVYLASEKKIFDDFNTEKQKRFPVLSEVDEKSKLLGGGSGVEPAKKITGEQAYHRLSGESEARLTQARLDMTQTEREVAPFWKDYDVPVDQQIVRYGSGPSQSLPMDEASRMARAREMGFDVDQEWYHGTKRDIKKMSNEYPSHSGLPNISRAHFLTKDPEYASDMAWYGSSDNPGPKKDFFNKKIMPNVMPLKLKKGNYFEAKPTARQHSDPAYEASVLATAKQQGYDGVKFASSDEYLDDYYAVFKPENIRSKFAKFDPSKADSANILAGAAAVGLGASATWQQILGVDNGQ